MQSKANHVGKWCLVMNLYKQLMEKAVLQSISHASPRELFLNPRADKTLY